MKWVNNKRHHLPPKNKGFLFSSHSINTILESFCCDLPSYYLDNRFFSGVYTIVLQTSQENSPISVYLRVCVFRFSFTDYDYPQATINMFENDSYEEYDLYSCKTRE